MCKLRALGPNPGGTAGGEGGWMGKGGNGPQSDINTGHHLRGWDWRGHKGVTRSPWCIPQWPGPKPGKDRFVNIFICMLACAHFLSSRRPSMLSAQAERRGGRGRGGDFSPAVPPPFFFSSRAPKAAYEQVQIIGDATLPHGSLSLHSLGVQKESVFKKTQCTNEF